VVIGIDFTPASLAGARWAASYLTRASETVLAHVVPPVDDVVDSTAGGAPSDQATTAAGLVGFGETLALAQPRATVLAGRPSHVLHTLVAQTGADLLILGRRADSARRRVGEPNVRERAARRTAASVLVVPQGTTRGPNHVLAAIDDGPFTALVLRAAAAIAAVHGISLSILRVLPPVSGAYERIIDGARRTRRGDRSESPAEVATEADLPAPASPRRLSRIVTRYGDPAREIVSAAAALGAALIVVGKRGSDFAPIGSLGSVARTLMGFSSLPVLAVDFGG
jgi:nucleotide-binding universal stress UspA family protein